MIVERPHIGLEHREELPRWIRASQAAEILGVSRSQIARMIARGQLSSRPHPTNPRGVLVDRDEVEALRAQLREIEDPDS